MTQNESAAAAHDALIRDQFTRQAEGFAAVPALHSAEALAMLVTAANPGPEHTTLDIACGPGSVVVAMSKRARHATGLDATAAMLDQARALAAAEGRENLTWVEGNVYALPFEPESFDIVTCRFAIHHFARPLSALAEMARVCRAGGVVLVCDAIASDDKAKAAAFNEMERHRDPSTVEFLTLRALRDLFAAADLPPPLETAFQVPDEAATAVTRSFPDDAAKVLHMFEAAVEGDGMGLNTRREGDRILFAYPCVILTAVKPVNPAVR
jgi:ubiquinone/menaquinone biosynthesis C-methylase UbiE